MAEPINLKRARKARAREQARAEAAENRARFGRTAAEKAIARTEAERADRVLAGARLDPPEREGG